jgi:hypothetical protein
VRGGPRTRTPSVALRLVLPDHLADVWLVDTVCLVALAGRARTADASQLQVPRFFGTILADPADASANRQFGFMLSTDP